ncbi:hypothetical protein [Leptolyngbya ohadii]|uniref:hypothetical protein n=1 Tax=Leptolyngbya ohadii TaxID=1962290 RepID=UPI000B59A8FB|nr:hypothetical protein [Leptolyngbya ohadii]
MQRGQNPEFLEQVFPTAADVEGELAKKPLSVKFPVEVDRQIREIPGYSAKVRQWVMEGMQREGQPPASAPAVDLKATIVQVLPTIPIKERTQAAKHFKKLLKAVQQGQSS